MNFKEFYNKYINWIVVVLICLVMLKGCQSCTKERRLEFNEIRTEQIVDSLNNEISSLYKQIDSLNNDIALKNKDINHLKSTNDNLSTANKHYRVTNNTLVNTNKKLTEKNDTIK